MVQDVDDQVHVADEDGLGEIEREGVVAFGDDAFPLAGSGLGKRLHIQLVQPEPNLQALKKLVGPQLAERDRLEQIPEGLIAKPLINVAQIH